MTSDQKARLGKEISNLGFTASKHETDLYKKGNSQIRITGNGINHDGNRRDTYSVAKNYLDNKQGK